MSEVSISEVTKNGLWTNNPALVQLLGLCPLLAVTGSVVNALGLGIATLAVLVGSNTIAHRGTPTISTPSIKSRALHKSYHRVSATA